MSMKGESEKAGLKLSIKKMKIMASSPITSWQIDEETMETVRLFPWSPKSLQMVTVAMKLKILTSWEKGYDKPRQCVKKQRHHFSVKGLSGQGYGFSSGHVWM